MKIRGWYNHRLLKCVQLITLVGTPLGLVYILTYQSWLHIIITILTIIVIAKIGHSAGQHRYFCHRSFTTGKKREWLLGLLSTLCTTYSAPYYAAVHRYHHKVSDTEQDPHSPRKQGLFKSFLGFVDKDNVAAISGSTIRDLITNKPAMFFHNWYWPTLLSYWLLLLLIDPILIVSAYIIPVGYTQFVNGTQTFFGHKWGYTNYDLSDDSRNNIWWNILTLGEGLHNNHHKRPGEWNFAWDNRHGEWDFTAWLIKVFLIKR